MTSDVVLCVETSGAGGGVLAAEGDRIVVSALPLAPRSAAALAPTVRDALAELDRKLADVRLFCFSAGPGSFTGLRIAATMARMLQSVTGCDVIATPTLSLTAMNAPPTVDMPVLALLDARPGEVFAAFFDPIDSTLRERIPAALHKEDALFDQLSPPFVALGAGVAKRRDRITALGGVVLDEALWAPRVERVHELGLAMRARGEICKPEEIRPLYLRPPECEEVFETRRAAARARRGAAS